MVHAAGWCCRYVCSMCFTGSFKRLLCFAPRYKHGEIEISPKESLWGDRDLVLRVLELAYELRVVERDREMV